LNYRAVIKKHLVALGIYGLLFLPVSIWLAEAVTPDHGLFSGVCSTCRYSSG